jgi:hypothetical protein
MEYKNFMPVEFLEKIYSRPYSLRCKCHNMAKYILFEICSSGIMTYNVSSYCEDCIHKVLKRKKMKIVTDWDEIKFLQVQFKKEQEKYYEEIRTKHQKAYEDEMSLNGKVLRMSGFKGGVYELPDKSLKCIMNNGEEIIPCCWNNAAYIIDNRIGIRQKHDENCLKKGE